MAEPVPEPRDDAFEKLVERAEELTRHFEQHPNGAVREDVFELLQTIDEIHRDAILSLVELMLRSGNHDLIHAAAEHAKISALFQLYEVLPLPELVRWQEALDTVRPTLKEHNADVELMRIADAMPFLRLKGGFTADESNLRQLVQESISTIFGSYQSVKWEPRDRPPVPPRFVPVTQNQTGQKATLGRHSGRRGHAREWPAQSGNPKNGCVGVPIGFGLVCFSNACPGSALPLHMGRIANETLFCPWHACAFDVRTGKRKTGSGQDLKPLTLRIEAGKIQLGIWE